MKHPYDQHQQRYFHHTYSNNQNKKTNRSIEWTQ